jgi:hypothetical protein
MRNVLRDTVNVPRRSPMTLQIPNSSVQEIMLEPITVPSAKPPLFFRMDVIQVTSSGMLVPTAIAVNPTTVSLIPRSEASRTPWSTKRNAPITSIN